MRTILTAAVLSILLLTGCGGSGSLSSSQLRSSATRVCTLANQRSGRIATPQSPADGLLFLKRGVAVLGPELAHLRTLKPSSELAGDYSTSLTAFSSELKTLEKTMHGLSAGADPVLAMKDLQRRLAPLEAREDDAWRKLGISACLNR